MDFDVIHQLEMELLSPSARKHEARLHQLLADDFEEVGQSGVKYTKAQIISSLLDEDVIGVTAQQFNFRALSDNCVLVTYMTTHNNQSAYRCSIWKKYSQGWKIHFHQGTPKEAQ